MYLLRLQAVINNTPLLLKNIALFAADGVTLVSLYDPVNGQAISNVFKTDASGFISFKIATLQTLTFKTLQGLTLSPAAYPLYSATAPVTPPINVIESEITLPCAETILEGYAVKVNGLGQLEKCSANNLTHVNTLIGLAKQTGNIGEIITVSEDEFMTNTAWAWVPDKPVFLGVNGTLTQDTTGLLFVQQVGVALTATKIVIRISQPFIRI